jgi:uncharacterized membrane protein (UPF0127 family)
MELFTMPQHLGVWVFANTRRVELMMQRLWSLCQVGFLLLARWWSRGQSPSIVQVGIAGSQGHRDLLWTVRWLRSKKEKQMGLLNHVSLEATQGLLLGDTRAVHSVGMAFAILVVFLDKDHGVLGTKVLPPQQAVAGPPGTKHVLELHPSQQKYFLNIHGAEKNLRTHLAVRDKGGLTETLRSQVQMRRDS